MPNNGYNHFHLVVVHLVVAGVVVAVLEVAVLEVAVLVGLYWVRHFELEDLEGLKIVVQPRRLKAERMAGTTNGGGTDLAVEVEVLVASHEEEEKETEVIAAVDFRGHPVDKTKTGGWLAARLILAMNLVTYLVRDLNLPSPDSATIVTNVMGTVNLLGLVGGFLADAKLGRYLTVAISTTIAAVMKVLFQHRTEPNNDAQQQCLMKETTREREDEEPKRDGQRKWRGLETGTTRRRGLDTGTTQAPGLDRESNQPNKLKASKSR
ncbi:hypothetical protein LR48_Vigan630s000600 [Vigna angularis]|uniref:Uncharacterized protein n=1 Tax=Phaseolus angularis TaxID=3914 RepID=A0A0L9TF57_PHAAN|nr:hypothetical protein LR48_Vigan630s000600 [Vigna angularis]